MSGANALHNHAVLYLKVWYYQCNKKSPNTCLGFVNHT